MLHIGDILDNTYEIKERIGSGGGGIIFRAYHRRMKKDVALKLIKDNVKGIIKDRSEVDILKNLKHEYLPQVLDFAEDNGDVYTVMEFINGCDFKQLIRAGRTFSEKEIRKYAIQLCEAVRYLHSQEPPIIHSDIKPANIMLTPKDDICLIDFNISAISSSNDGAYSLGGSKGFAAPEQFRKIVSVPVTVDEFHEETRFIDDFDDETEFMGDEPEQVNYPTARKTKNVGLAYIDMRTDIYGIGASIFFMITGRVPANGVLDFKGTKISGGLKRIIIKAMNPEPEKRYKNAEEMLHALRSLSGRKSKLSIVAAASAIIFLTFVGICGISIIYKYATWDIADTASHVSESDVTETVIETSAETTVPETTSVTTSLITTAKPVETTAETTTSEPEAEKVSSIEIKGKRYLTSLQVMDLSNEELTDDDIKELDKMTNLTNLSLYGNKIEDISILAEMTNLKKLNLGNNCIKDISPLSKLTNLTELYLHQNQISDIGPIANLTSLQLLYIWENQVSSINPLKGLKDLTELDLGCNNLTDISALNNMTKLKKLFVYSNQIEDISALKEMNFMTELYISDNRIKDISPLEKLTSLEILYVWGNNISDISVLSGCNNLKDLELDSNQIEDIRPLENLTKLRTLSLCSNNISNISALRGLTTLNELYLSSNKISDISVFRELSNIRILYIWGNEISDISPLSGLTKLTELYIGSNQITDISPLAGMTKMRIIYLDNNPIDDADVLRTMNSLEEFDLSNTYLSSEEIEDLKKAVLG